MCATRTGVLGTHTGAIVSVRSKTALYSIYAKALGVVSPRIASTLGARNLEAGVVSLIVMKLISVLKFRNRYFEMTPLFSSARFATDQLATLVCLLVCAGFIGLITM